MATDTTESTPQESTEPKPAAKGIKKSAGKKSTAKKASLKKSAARKTTAKKPAKKNSSTKKKTAKKPVVAKKSGAKKSSAKKAAPKKRKPKKQAVTYAISKAQSIRDTFEELGKKARPKHIIAALAEKGIFVTSPQVTQTLKAAGLRRGRRRQKVQAEVVVPKASANGHGFNLDDLLKVKKLAEEVGGTAKVKELAAALERLI